MTASSIAVDVRGALKTALSGVAANVYDAVPATGGSAPFVAVVPSNPYFDIQLIGKSVVKLHVNMVLTCAVTNYDNPSGLDNIEKLLISVLAAMPAGYTIGSVSQPIPLELASGAIVLASEIQISTYYTQTT